MNALADAAFLSAAEGPPPYGSTAYTDAELQAMGAAGGLAGPLQGGLIGPPLAMPGRSMMPQHLPGPGRHLQIMDHTVHRIDTNIKANGEEEKEMVVSNLRHFTLKIGVIDRSGGGRETELPLKAELLYENGQLVEQLATCEPLLVGKTQVVAMQGMALFKLRITSLSSHRDKQRFRIRVSPVDTSLLLREPHLTAVTTPMKCVTKLSHRGSSGNKEGEGEETNGGDNGNGDDGDASGTKRKRDDIEPMLEAQGHKLQELHQMNVQILEQLKNIKATLSAQQGEGVATKEKPKAS
jgi:hypothetical protein